MIQIKKEKQVFKITGQLNIPESISYDGSTIPTVEIEVTIFENIQLTYITGQTVIINEGKEASFRSNDEYKNFIRVIVDEKEIDAANYDVKEGSIIVTLKASYLSTLKEGEHTIVIVSENGKAEGRFTVKKATSTPAPITTVTDDDYVVPNTGVK